MFELIDTNPAVDVQESEYQRLLGYPKNRVLEGRARELADAARSWYRQNGRPWICARETAALQLRDEKLWIGAADFSSQRLHAVFASAQAHSAVLVAVSAGRECEEHARALWDDNKPDEFFFVKVFGSAVVEHLVMLASSRICGWAADNELTALPHFSPGFSGWDMAEQLKLWAVFGEHFNGCFPGSLEVLESGMLKPEKSLLALFGLSRHPEKARRFAALVPCENCALQNCRYRRAPYKRSWSEFSNGHREFI